MNRLIISILLIGLLLTAFIIFSYSSSKPQVTKGNVYEGPVRPTDDEIYFRETGKTRTLGEK